jgi:hypothetical protein
MCLSLSSLKPIREGPRESGQVSFQRKKKGKTSDAKRGKCCVAFCECRLSFRWFVCPFVGLADVDFDNARHSDKVLLL